MSQNVLEINDELENKVHTDKNKDSEIKEQKDSVTNEGNGADTSTGQEFRFISPDNFNEFIYSKKSHLELFSKNNYDIEFLGQRIDLSNCNIKKIQLLTVYSFISQNIKEGANILEITSEKETELLHHFKLRYNCYKTVNVKELEIQDSAKDKLIKGEKFGETNSFEYLKPDSFDLIYSTAGFGNLNENNNDLTVIVNNVIRLIKPGGYSLYCFKNIEASNNKFWIHNLFYHIFGKKRHDVKIQNKYVNPYDAVHDPDIFSIFKDYKVDNLKISPIRNYSKEGTVFSFNILRKKKSLELPVISKTKNSNLSVKNAFVFHHLMKCGGSSIVLSLKNWFFLKYDLLERTKDLNIFINRKCNTEEMFNDYCLTGHFQYNGIFLHQRYPEILNNREKFKLFTFIRDPLNIKISLYYYVIKGGAFQNRSVKLKDNLMYENNFLSSLFPCDESNYKEILDRYFFIGIVEKMQESMDKLASLTDKRKIIVPVSNTTEKDSQVSDLTPEFIEKFKEKNKLDYLIYNYCLEKFDKL